MSHDQIATLMVIAARLPLYLYVAYVGWQHRHVSTTIPMKILALMGIIGAVSAVLSAFSGAKLFRDLIGGGFAILLFIIAYRANQKIIRGKYNGTKTI